MKQYALCLLALLCVVAPVSSAATPKQRAVVTPSSVEARIAAGESETRELTVVNKGTEAFFLEISAAPYSVQGDSYEARYEPLPGAPDVTKWVVVTPPADQKIRIKPEAVQKVSYVMTIPQSTPPGGYTMALFATTTPDTPSESVTVHNRVAVIHYITVKGAAEARGNASAAPFKSLSWDGILQAQFSVENTGATHFMATARTVIKTPWGREVSRVEDERYVLPFTKRQITLDWRAESAAGVYLVEQSIDYLDHTEQFPSRWFIVIHPMILAGVVLLALGFAFFLSTRKHRHQKKP